MQKMKLTIEEFDLHDQDDCSLDELITRLTEFRSRNQDCEFLMDFSTAGYDDPAVARINASRMETEGEASARQQKEAQVHDMHRQQRLAQFLTLKREFEP